MTGRLTAEDLNRFRRDLVGAFPEADDSFVQYAVASETLINLVGPEWWARALGGAHSDPYFVKHADDVPGRVLHEHRVTSLATHLLECQPMPGFDAMVADLRSRSLLGAANELAAAHRFLASGHSINFIERSGVAGRDFDFLVDGNIAVEVKAKEDRARYVRSSLDGVISKARRQVPSSGPSVIVLRIPDAWATDTAFVRDAEAVFTSRLRNSRRLNAIVVLWGQWLPLTSGGMLCAVRFRTFSNLSPRSPIANVERLIEGFSHSSILKLGPHDEITP